MRRSAVPGSSGALGQLAREIALSRRDLALEQGSFLLGIASRDFIQIQFPLEPRLLDKHCLARLLGE